MTNTSHLVNRGGYARLKNVARCLTLTETLKARGPHLPGLGVFHGHSGYGKTYAAIEVQKTTQSLYVEVGDSWTKKTLLQKILKEADVVKHDQPVRGTIPELMEKAINALVDAPDRPLIIDEADKLADKGNLEIIRELHDFGRAPILLIGEELLPQKIQHLERVHNRVLEWVPAEPCDEEDARTLANMFAPNLELSDDLIEKLVAVTRGLARRINVNLEHMVRHGRRTGKKDFSAKDFQDTWFYTGQPPRRRAA